MPAQTESKPYSRINDNFLESFFATWRSQGLAEQTLREYVRHLRGFARYVGRCLNEVTRHDLEMYVTAESPIGGLLGALSDDAGQLAEVLRATGVTLAAARPQGGRSVGSRDSSVEQRSVAVHAPGTAGSRTGRSVLAQTTRTRGDRRARSARRARCRRIGLSGAPRTRRGHRSRSQSICYHTRRRSCRARI